MRNLLITSILSLGFLAFCHSANAQGSFGYGFNSGFGGFGGVVWVHRGAPPARYDSRIDPALIRAARLAYERSGRHSMSRCWHYVKAALVDAGAVRYCPTTAYACQAGEELVSKYGFVQLRVRDPYSAPIGSVIVYSGHGAGHVELRTANGFASDYHSAWACRYHLVGVYAKLAS